MQQYIGHKIINAKPMSRSEYNTFRGCELIDYVGAEDQGYLVEYIDGGQANTTEYQGYVSWSPKDVFERAYKASGNLSFGDAVSYMKQGYKVARSGWNGKNMWIAITTGNSALPADQFWNKHSKAYAEQNEGFAPVDPCVIMKTAQGSIAMGWLASQADMLSEDWEVLV